MSNTKTILEPAAVTSPPSLASVNGGECERLLNIGIFFDGTNNNHNEPEYDASVDTNIWKLSRAYRFNPQNGQFREYISGVGTRFAELNKTDAEPGGGPFGVGGEARILYGLLQIINFAQVAIKGSDNERFAPEARSALCSDAQVSGHLGESNEAPTKDQQVLRDLGLPHGLVGASDFFKKKFFSQECARLHDLLANRKTCPIVKSIYFDVLGFSRGAAQARVFVTWLHRYMLMGGQIFGVPSYVRMLGLFDTVASVGPSDAAASDGHHTWASAENLQIHPAVKNCVHYIALHELRTNFPSDSVRVGDTLPPNCHEHITPGAHSDVGGGYAPLDQGKGVRLLKGTRLGAARSSSIMGVGAISGEAVPDRQSKFRLVLGPLTLPQYLRFMPQGRDLPRLVEWVRAFVGHEFEWEAELRVCRDKAPPARLEDKEKLGWSTWLGDPSSSPEQADYTVGLIFEPERYLANPTSGHGAAIANARVSTTTQH